MAFQIKQGDTLPNIPFQFFKPNGDPLPLADATNVRIAVRGKTPGAPLLFKKPCTITTEATGIGVYDWDAGDTDTAGEFVYEFEITWDDGNVQTIPANAYFDLTIIDDIG